ncbi:MAG: hypothetical protein RL186_1747 [Pseudomonadota bacterium]
MDVVWCRFPFDERPGIPQDPPHPALVFEVREFQPEKLSVLVAFGTSNLKRADHGENLVLQNVTEMNWAGLYMPTLFDLGRTKRLVWTDRWFVSPDSKRFDTPKIGSLSYAMQDRLKRILRIRQSRGLSVPVPQSI